MKKKIVLCLLVGCLMASLIGCGSDTAEEAAATEAATEEENEGKGGRGEEETETAAETSEETEETEVSDASGVPVLGGDNVEGYEDFAYLYEEILMTETEENKETGKKERKSLTVYIPDDEYARADGNYAYADAMGVSFKVELEPYLRYDADDYLPEENLDDYLSNQYDPFYTADYKDMVITEAKAEGDGVVATVEYCKYNDWDDIYYSVFCTYYLVELENGETVMVSVEVNSSEVTGKAAGLIEELEQFYQFDIYWDAEKAEQKSANYAENGAENTYSTGSLLFELPEGWAEDDSISSYETRVYAPDGDADFSACMISIQEEYVGFDEEVNLNALLEDNSEELLKEAFGSSLSEYSAEICDTGLGKAAKISFSISEGENSATITMYIVADDYKAYTLTALQSADAIENAQIVLDGIMATGQLRD